MKIGILSMQKILNYGSFLQAYALKNTIESLGHDVCFVDYRIGEPVFKDETLGATVTAGNKFFSLKYFAKKLLGREIYFFKKYMTLCGICGIL